MAMLNPGDAGVIARNWITKLKDSSQKYRLAVNALTQSPMEAAAQQENYWASRVAEAARNQKFSAGLRRVTLAQWKAAASTVGADRIATLPDVKAQKFTAFMQRWLPTLISVQQRVRQMPRDTYEQRRARALAMMDGLHQAAQQAQPQAQGGGMFALPQ